MEIAGQQLSMPGKEAQNSLSFEETFEESRKLMEGARLSTQTLKETAGENPNASIQEQSIDNPLFASLKDWTKSFHKDFHKNVASIKEEEITDFVRNFHLQLSLNDCLKKLLKEVLMTADKDVQNKYLQKVNDWFGLEKKSIQSAFPIPQREVNVSKSQMKTEEEKVINDIPKSPNREIEVKARPTRNSKNNWETTKVENNQPTKGNSPLAKPLIKKLGTSRQLDEITGFRIILENGRAEWNHTHFIFAFDCSGIYIVWQINRRLNERGKVAISEEKLQKMFIRFDKDERSYCDNIYI